MRGVGDALLRPSSKFSRVANGETKHYHRRGIEIEIEIETEKKGGGEVVKGKGEGEVGID